MTEFQRLVYRTVRLVPRGRVASYGGVAAVLGKPRAARGVGRALCALDDDSDVPWWRIVNRNGEISIRCATHGAAVQRAMLEREGVRFDAHGRIDWQRFGWKGPHKRSVALAIRSDDGDGVLAVQRPLEDDDLPGIWGLPAATLAPDEDWHEAVHRAARDKLGVVVEIGPEIARGEQDREAYTIEMRLHSATIVEGEPKVPQHATGVTQYRGWRWASGKALRPGAERGSLCCRLYLAGR